MLIAAKKSRTFAKVGANPVSDIGDQTTHRDEPKRQRKVPIKGDIEVSVGDDENQ